MTQSEANPSPTEIPCSSGNNRQFSQFSGPQASARRRLYDKIQMVMGFALVSRTGNLKWPNRESSEAKEGKSEMARARAPRLPRRKALHSMKMKTALNPTSKEPQALVPKLPPDHWGKDFQPIALLLTPNPPQWLKECLHLFCCAVWTDWVLVEEQPTRAQLLQTLVEVRGAVDLLMKILVRADLLAFLGSEDRLISLPRIMILQMNLKDICDRASIACQSPELVDKDGKARPGQGRAYAAKRLSTRTYCALVIAECWRRFDGNYPPPRNRKAAEAAEVLWQMAIGKKSGIGGTDVLAAWRSHFRKAESPEADSKRAEICEIIRNWEATFCQAKTGASVGDEFNQADLPAIRFRRQTGR